MPTCPSHGEDPCGKQTRNTGMEKAQVMASLQLNWRHLFLSYLWQEVEGLLGCLWIPTHIKGPCLPCGGERVLGNGDQDEEGHQVCLVGIAKGHGVPRVMPEDRIQTPQVLWANIPLNSWGSEMSCYHRYFEAALAKAILFIFYYVWRWHPYSGVDGGQRTSCGVSSPFPPCGCQARRQAPLTT